MYERTASADRFGVDGEYAQAADLDSVTVIRPGDIGTRAGEESTEKTTAREVLKSGGSTVRRGRPHRRAPNEGRQDKKGQYEASDFHDYLLLNRDFLRRQPRLQRTRKASARR
jgi:hypothetical protein